MAEQTPVANKDQVMGSLKVVAAAAQDAHLSFAEHQTVASHFEGIAKAVEAWWEELTSLRELRASVQAAGEAQKPADPALVH